ncbi:MAG TPA: HAMP domain-containing sensor histidine kinase [Caulobacter sp.]|nr:HAMP domain-containing sensor histidine kinase [Caulobacter sp.]
MPRTARQSTDPPSRDAAESRREDHLARHAAGLDEGKRQFLRMVSHELRTPLNSIIGFSEILIAELYGPLGARQYREYAQHIRQSGDRLLKLVNQILEIARLEGQVVDLDPRPEALDHVFDDVRVQVKEELALHRAHLVVEDEGALPTVIADARGVRSLFRNLVENAIVYGPDFGTVAVRARRRGATVEIDIEDNGEGVDPADIPRLMNPFAQGENALTRDSDGAGLGLSIARLTAQAMGGALVMTSAPGLGTCVTVTLPAA